MPRTRATQPGAVAAAPTMEFFEKASDPDANIGTHPAQRLQDDLEVTVRIEFLVPHDFTTLHTAEIILVPGGTGDLIRSVATNWGACTEDYNTHTDTIAEGAEAVTTNDIECLDISAALTGIAAGDFVGIEFIRHADDVLDTVNADCYFLGFRFRYT